MTSPAVALRLDLARVYGGGPAYWLDVDLDHRIIETAIDLLNHRKESDE